MNKLTSMLSTLTEPVVIVDTNMFIIYQNGPSIRALGDRFGEKCYKAIEKREQACGNCPAAQTFRDGKYHRTITRVDLQDGLHSIELVSHPIQDTDGELVECVVFHRDLSSAKDMEAQKSDMLSMLSHDLKGHMTVILSYSEILLEKLSGIGEEEIKALSRIKYFAAESSRLLGDFLTLSKMEAGKMTLDLQPSSLAALAKFYAGEFEVLARDKDVNIHTDIPADLPHASLDVMHCGRMISNVLANAIKYSRQGGRVWVRAGVVQEDPNKVFLEVADEGPGIPEKDLPHITERYHRAGQSELTQGTGLGLSIVKAITELHCGELEIKSREGEGTNVRIVLPAAAATQ